MSSGPAFEAIMAAEDQLERDQEARALRNLRDHQAEIADIKQLMDSREGRRFVRRLLQKSGIFGRSFHANNASMAQLAGQRDAGVDLYEQIRAHCREQYVLLEQEWMEDDR